MIKMCDIIIAS